MKLIKTIIAATLIATGLFGLQAFARGGGGGGGHAGGGGFAGGAVGRASMGFAPHGGGGSGTRGDRAGRVGRNRFAGFGYGYGGYGWGGYGWAWGNPYSSYDGAGEPQAVDTSTQDYEHERDRRRLALPDSAFVKNYGRPAQQ
jgi:hypothetical protein